MCISPYTPLFLFAGLFMKRYKKKENEKTLLFVVCILLHVFVPQCSVSQIHPCVLCGFLAFCRNRTAMNILNRALSAPYTHIHRFLGDIPRSETAEKDGCQISRAQCKPKHGPLDILLGISRQQQ